MNHKQAQMNMPGSMIAGMALGVVLGFLFAPRSGEETRMKLREAGIRLKHKAEDTKHQVQEKIGEGADKAKDATSKLASRAEDKAENIRSRSTRNGQTDQR